MESTVIYDVLEVFEQLYGYKPYKLASMPEKPTQETPFKLNGANQKKTTFKGSSIYGGQDLVGREVFLPVTIQAGGKTYEFPFSVLSMRRRKIIESTPMVERGGSVKELIALDDWRITMKGFLIDPLNQFPDQMLYELNEIFELNQPVRLKCALSDLFLDADDYVVITDLDIPDKARVEGVREFAFAMESDSILTLTLD